MPRPFRQVDVFTSTPYLGNPVAVVHDADDLSTEQMQAFARWTNLSETTFLLQPTSPEASYRVRIFAPGEELKFAGHPTLGSCHAWLEAGGRPREAGAIVQECGIGNVPLRQDGDRLAFRAPRRIRTGPPAEALIERAANGLQIGRSQIEAAEWVDNGGPPWVAMVLPSVEEVLAVKPVGVDFDLGIIGFYPPGSAEAFEIRAFFWQNDATIEDPVTGSLNAGVAEWLVESGRLPAPYVAGQGKAIGRAGRIHVSQDESGGLWIGGGSVTCVTGEVAL